MIKKYHDANQRVMVFLLSYLKNLQQL